MIKYTEKEREESLKFKEKYNLNQSKKINGDPIPFNA